MEVISIIGQTCSTDFHTLNWYHIFVFVIITLIGLLIVKMTMLEKDVNKLPRVLDALMDECKIDNHGLSKQTNIPVSTIIRMRNNPEANPTASTLRPIAKYFDISISQLLGDEPLQSSRIPGTHCPIPTTSIFIPVISWESVLGFTINADSNTIIRWLSSEKPLTTKAFGITISSRSLGPAFQKNSVIIAEPEYPHDDGDYVLVLSKDTGTISLKHLLFDGTDRYLRSVNPAINKTSSLSSDDIILGTIVEIRYSPESAISEIQDNIQTSKTINELRAAFTLKNT